jgi:hypothetical protein
MGLFYSKLWSSQKRLENILVPPLEESDIPKNIQQALRGARSKPGSPKLPSILNYSLSTKIPDFPKLSLVVCLRPIFIQKQGNNSVFISTLQLIEFKGRHYCKNQSPLENQLDGFFFFLK